MPGEGYHTLHIFSSSSMRTKLSDRERGAGGSRLGWCTFLIFADYASDGCRWSLQYNRNILCSFFSLSWPAANVSYFGS